MPLQNPARNEDIELDAIEKRCEYLELEIFPQLSTARHAPCAPAESAI
jgi:hypothetical protein